MDFLNAARPFVLLLLTGLASLTMLYEPARIPAMRYVMGVLGLFFFVYTFAYLRQAGVLRMTIKRIYRASLPAPYWLLLDCVVTTMGAYACKAIA